MAMSGKKVRCLEFYHQNEEQQQHDHRLITRESAIQLDSKLSLMQQYHGNIMHARVLYAGCF